MDRRIKTIGELEQVFEPCHMMLKGLKRGLGVEEAPPTTMFLPRKEKH